MFFRKVKVLYHVIVLCRPSQDGGRVIVIASPSAKLTHNTFQTGKK